MNLAELVLEARKKDRKFNKAIKERILMKTYPTLKWLMPQLERVLGKSYVSKAAQDHIESKE